MGGRKSGVLASLPISTPNGENWLSLMTAQRTATFQVMQLRDIATFYVRNVGRPSETAGKHAVRSREKQLARRKEMEKDGRYSRKYTCASFVVSTRRLPRAQWDREDEALAAFAIDGDAMSFVCPKQRLIERPNWSVEWRADQPYACVLFGDNPQPIFWLFVGSDSTVTMRTPSILGFASY